MLLGLRASLLSRGFFSQERLLRHRPQRGLNTQTSNLEESEYKDRNDAHCIVKFWSTEMDFILFQHHGRSLGKNNDLIRLCLSSNLGNSRIFFFFFVMDGVRIFRISLMGGGFSRFLNFITQLFFIFQTLHFMLFPPSLGFISPSYHFL